MTKINGTEVYTPISVPEVLGEVGDTRLFRAACNLFLSSRGLRVNHDYNQHYKSGARPARTARVSSHLRSSNS